MTQDSIRDILVLLMNRYSLDAHEAGELLRKIDLLANVANEK